MMTSEKLLSHLQNNPFVLAPMAGITDDAFRSFMKKMGAGIVVSELVSASGLEFNSARTKKLLKYSEDQRPVGLQIFGDKPEHMATAAKYIQDGGADFVDINFGCPVPKVVKRGAGSGALKDLPHLTNIIRSVVQAVNMPVTIKIRTGWDANMLNADEVCNIAHNEGVTWVAIHGRTRAQGYAGLADWKYIQKVKSTAKLPVLGNGDILTPEAANNRTLGLDGVLIGRGALRNPFIFAESMALKKSGYIPSDVSSLDLQFKNSTLGTRNSGATSLALQSGVQLKETPRVRDFTGLMDNLLECYRRMEDERLICTQLKKFSAWFATGFPGAAQFRREVFQLNSIDEVMSLANAILPQIRQTGPEDASVDFLMADMVKIILKTNIQFLAPLPITL